MDYGTVLMGILFPTFSEYLVILVSRLKIFKKNTGEWWMCEYMFRAAGATLCGFVLYQFV